ncbi:MAG: DUF2914 domain-containing protein [Proteobacteria bacterium]|nr:DUF2914 domain-containing protein [Desulfobacula sp.]MBU3951786.1 DUF2914 domain-containing protein [Pseudomonadota bacterium]MBU4131412.1 DUF2914 domain-containing protein [Pseudomonadota bacterium]
MKIILTKKSNKYRIPALLVFFMVLGVSFTTSVCPQQANGTMVMTQAVMCESIETFKPLNPAVVFSISQGEVYCFSNFDPVVQKTIVFHKWYKRDQLIFTMQLTLMPPKWSSFSRIQLRDADKGPWRVEIRTAEDTLLQTLRFSIVD